MLGTIKKRPDDQLDYDIDFIKWLSEGDTLLDASAESDGEALVVNSVEVFGQVVKVWLSGGDAGASYKVDVTATTIQGRVKEVTFILRVTEC